MIDKQLKMNDDIVSSATMTSTTLGVSANENSDETIDPCPYSGFKCAISEISENSPMSLAECRGIRACTMDEYDMYF